jgi:hypothetical protein
MHSVTGYVALRYPPRGTASSGARGMLLLVVATVVMVSRLRSSTSSVLRCLLLGHLVT